MKTDKIIQDFRDTLDAYKAGHITEFEMITKIEDLFQMLLCLDFQQKNKLSKLDLELYRSRKEVTELLFHNMEIKSDNKKLHSEIKKLDDDLNRVTNLNQTLSDRLNEPNLNKIAYDYTIADLMILQHKMKDEIEQLTEQINQHKEREQRQVEHIGQLINQKHEPTLERALEVVYNFMTDADFRLIDFRGEKSKMEISTSSYSWKPVNTFKEAADFIKSYVNEIKNQKEQNNG